MHGAARAHEQRLGKQPLEPILARLPLFLFRDFQSQRQLNDAIPQRGEDLHENLLDWQLGLRVEPEDQSNYSVRSDEPSVDVCGASATQYHLNQLRCQLGCLSGVQGGELDESAELPNNCSVDLLVQVLLTMQGVQDLREVDPLVHPREKDPQLDFIGNLDQLQSAAHLLVHQASFCSRKHDPLSAFWHGEQQLKAFQEDLPALAEDLRVEPEVLLRLKLAVGERRELLKDLRQRG